jgi:predicted phosphate transport protein (TIGR00153 family)
MARKNDFDYFDGFVKLAEYSYNAAKLLDETLRNFNTETLQEKMEEMHEIEHAADLEGHEIMRRLAKEFITPIEREDIMTLIHEIDDITDCIEDVLLHMYMYNVKVIKEDAIKFSKLILLSCEELIGTFKEFKNFRKSKEIHNKIIKINRIEEEGDNLYTRVVRKLHLTTYNPTDIMTWTIAYNRLEKCCDACEEAVNVVESVIMKNS